MDKYEEIKNCRLCGSSSITEILNLGETPLANAFVRSDQLEEAEEGFPLTLFLCDCGSVQLKQTIRSEILFKNYLYESSTSASFRKHFEEYAKSVYGYCNLTGDDLVVEPGCNDLILLKPLKALGVKVLGVEPATNIVDKHKNEGIEVINDFLTVEVAKNIVRNHGQAKVIVANNVLAHLSNYAETFEAIDILLKHDGYLIFENAYWLKTFQNVDIGQIYHEHTAYHSIKPLDNFLRNYNLNIENIEFNNIQCGSFRIYARKNSREFVNYSVVLEAITKEEEAGLFSVKSYQNLTEKIKENGEKLNSILSEIYQKGTVAAYGYPAKATTISSNYKIGNIFSFIIEDAPLKKGLFSPGYHIPIVGPERINEADYLVIMAYNFAEQIIKNNPHFKGKWIIPFPEAKII